MCQRWGSINSDGLNESDQDEERSSHLDDLQVVFTALCRQPLDTTELSALCVGVMHGHPGAADELSRVQRPRHGLDVQRLGQRLAVAGGVHHHGLGARVDLCFHHGDFQDVRHRGLLSWRPRAGLWDQLGGGLCAAEHWRRSVGAAKGDLGDSGALRDDWLWWRRSPNKSTETCGFTNIQRTGWVNGCVRRPHLAGGGLLGVDWVVGLQRWRLGHGCVQRSVV